MRLDYHQKNLPILAMRGMCMFPDMTVHFDVERMKSVRAIEEAMHRDQEIFLVAQKDLRQDDPAFEDLYSVGTVATICQILKLPGGVMRVLVEGKYRGCCLGCRREEPYFSGPVMEMETEPVASGSSGVQALIRAAQELFEEYIDLAPKNIQENLMKVLGSENAAYVADFIAQNASFSYEEKQIALEEPDPIRRLRFVTRCMGKELKVLRLQADIQEKVRESVDKGQRDYYLREQLHVIHQELGEEDEEDEAEVYREKIRSLHLQEETEAKLLRECGRLNRQAPGSAEASVIRNYLDTCLELPWNVFTKERADVKAARRILDADHYGLEKVKERILELIAVKKLAPEMPGAILCLVGPPGVGKTSVAISIARCLNRKLGRISLGGVHDEADIRGHRKTYIGAMPGRIINGVIQAGSRNPLLLLDEVDKLGSDYRGDPSAALLEVLDSEQNSTFRDHYLEVPFDLSQCMFITTANTTATVPRALLDRMEVIELGSYTDEEKLRIAKRHLLPRELKKHGLDKTMLTVQDGAIRKVITDYTRESGVRNLERELGHVCRKAAMERVSHGNTGKITVTADHLEQFLGARKFTNDSIPARDTVGLVTGLAWTEVGGETLEVEAAVMEGEGKLTLSGNLGDVMKESAGAALTFLRTRADVLGIDPNFHKTKDIHVHFPEGAVPKDGPSAGIAICTAMASALTGRPVRRDLAMTGEISLRGRVMAIGGLREKTMAALRYGVHTVLIPADNEKDLAEIDPLVREKLEFIPVRHADRVLELALRPHPVLNEYDGSGERIPMAYHEVTPTIGVRQ